MKAIILTILLLSTFLTLVPPVQANSQFCHTESTVKVTGLINVADVVICSSHQDEYGEIGDIIALNLRVSLPNAAFTPTITITPTTPIGCTAGTATVRTISGTTGAAVSYFNTFTTTDSTCSIALRITVQASTTTVFDSDESFGAYCTCDENLDVDEWPTLNADIVDDTTADGALTNAISEWPTLKTDCDINPSSNGVDSNWFSFGGCAGATVSVPKEMHVRDPSGTYTAKALITWVMDAGVYSSSAVPTIFNSVAGQFPFESTGTCSIIENDLAGTTERGTDTRYRTGYWLYTITYTGSGCTVLFSISQTNAVAGLIPVTVHSNTAQLAVDLAGTINANIDGILNNILSGDINATLSGDIGFSGNFTDNSNTTIEPAYQDTEAYQKAKWMGIIFLGLILLAEWKKDAIYHLLATFVGALISVSNIEVLGLPRLVILALTVYQAWRLFKVVGNNRNNISSGSDASPS